MTTFELQDPGLEQAHTECGRVKHMFVSTQTLLLTCDSGETSSFANFLVTMHAK